MHLRNLSLFFLIIIKSTICQAIHLTEKDYFITIPENWVSISKAKLDELEQGPKLDLKSYLKGYALKDSSVSELPYFLLNYTKVPLIENALFKDVIQQESQTLKESGIEGKIYVDSSQFKFYYEIELQDKIILIGYIPGGEGMLYLTYFTDDVNLQNDKSTFLKLFNSAKMNEKFRNVNAYYEEAKEHERKAGQHATRAIIFLGVSLVLFFVSKKLKFKTKSQ